MKRTAFPSSSDTYFPYDDADPDRSNGWMHAVPETRKRSGLRRLRKSVPSSSLRRTATDQTSSGCHCQTLTFQGESLTNAGRGGWEQKALRSGRVAITE